MSDTPPSDPKTPSAGQPQGEAPEPFVRGRIVWGRPPETVFRTGPLPRPPQSWSQPTPRPRPAPARPAGDIFSGSMIPRAAPSTAVDLPPVTDADSVIEPAAPEATVEPVATKPRRARKSAPVEAPKADPIPDVDPVIEPSVEAEAPVPVTPEPIEPEDAVSFEPVAEAVFEPIAEPVSEFVVEAEPVRPKARPAPAVEIIVEPEATDQIDTVPPPLSTDQKTAADPRAIPSVVVTPTLYATVGAVIEKVKTNDTWRLAAVIGALVVTAGFIWLATLPSGDAPPLDMDAPPPAAPGLETPLVDEAPPVAAAGATPEAEAATPSTQSLTAVRPAQAAVTSRPASPAGATTPASRAAPTPQAETVTSPAIETAPLVVERPTAAAPAPTDPDAPMQTRPQPLN